MTVTDVQITDADIAAAEDYLREMVARKFQRSREAGEFERGIVSSAKALSDFVLTADCRTNCILVVSFLEDVFKQNFVERLKIDSAAKNSEFFGGNGPLSTFAQRVTIASGLDWVPPSFRKSADLLRKIRNEFAHNYKVYSLEEEPLRSWADALPNAEQAWISESRPNYRNQYIKAPLVTKYRIRIFSNAMFLVSGTVARARIMENQLHPDYREGGFAGLTVIEQELIDLVIEHCHVSLGLLPNGEFPAK